MSFSFLKAPHSWRRRGSERAPFRRWKSVPSSRAPAFLIGLYPQALHCRSIRLASRRWSRDRLLGHNSKRLLTQHRASRRPANGVLPPACRSTPQPDGTPLVSDQVAKLRAPTPALKTFLDQVMGPHQPRPSSATPAQCSAARTPRTHSRLLLLFISTNSGDRPQLRAHSDIRSCTVNPRRPGYSEVRVHDADGSAERGRLDRIVHAQQEPASAVPARRPRAPSGCTPRACRALLPLRCGGRCTRPRARSRADGRGPRCRSPPDEPPRPPPQSYVPRGVESSGQAGPLPLPPVLTGHVSSLLPY